MISAITKSRNLKMKKEGRLWKTGDLLSNFLCGLLCSFEVLNK